jgi:hypothetical protein
MFVAERDAVAVIASAFIEDATKYSKSGRR